MRLSDEQIVKFSERGDVTHAWYSYQMVRETLELTDLGGLSYEVYAQGSYANKTNIAGDSDVDLVIALKSAFYADKEDLSAQEIEEYEKYYQRSELTWQQFRETVLRVLTAWYFVKEKSKCVNVRSNLIRLPADVLIALDHRHYRGFPSFLEQDYIDGVQFYTSEDVKIINFPREHIRACRCKDKAVGKQFKPVVRVAKNARNMLIANDELPDGAAPSYFLESLLWNVPENCFEGNLRQAYRAVVGYLKNADDDTLKKMKFPNEMAMLFGEAQDAVWNKSDAQALIGGL
jgi:predicted nucleotidyltransferase